MLRLRGTKDVPQFQLSTFDLTCSGGTPGTWESTDINIDGPFPRNITNKTQYDGTIYIRNQQGIVSTASFKPNERVTVSSYTETAYARMYGGGETVIGLYTS